MATERRRKTQADELLALLKGHVNEWVELPDVMQAGGAQYNAMVHELRGRGHRIQNHHYGGRSWFRLVVAPVPTPQPQPTQPAESDRLFPDDAPLRHNDLG